MAVATAKIVWTQSTANKTVNRLLQLIRDFVVSNGWTVLTDNSALASPYIVLTYNRNTGYTGDNPIVHIAYLTTSSTNRFVMTAYETWNTVTSTGTNPSSNADRYAPVVSTTDNMTYYISCDSTFILVWSIVDHPTLSQTYRGPHGITCIERRAGDTDTGPFYGIVTDHIMNNGTNPGLIYVPKLWNGSVTTAAYYELYTKLSAITGLYGLDEAKKHVIFTQYAARTTLGRLRGQLYGYGLSTYHERVAHGTFLPSEASPQWMLLKPVPDYDNRYTNAVQVSSTITTLS